MTTNSIPPTNANNHTGYSLIDLGFALITGLLSSGIISYGFYIHQRRKDEKEQRDFITFLYLLWKQGVRVTDVTERIERKIDGLISSPDSPQKLAILDAEYRQASGELWKAFKAKDKSKYFEAALTYKEIADARADAAISQQSFAVLESNGRLTIERIQQAHSAMFPDGYAWAGTLREDMVAIVGNFQAAGRTINPTLSSYQVQLVAPEDVPDRMNALVTRWNDNVPHLRGDDPRSLSEELAHFHHDFLLIHPFMDGNGRIARIILNEQASYLLQRRVVFSFDRPQYYEALHMADLREMARLTELIMGQIE